VTVSLRLAREADLPAINAIYNHYVLHATCTYQLVPETEDGRRAWFLRHGEKHPVTVAEIGREIVGWGALNVFNSREAYARTVENSVYVAPEWHRRGIGGALLRDLIERARALGHHTIIAGISAEQSASVALHEAHGFVKVGYLREVGCKFGQWLDVATYQVLL
jgi:L-amino acid N-acyltransferase YncA